MRTTKKIFIRNSTQRLIPSFEIENGREKWVRGVLALVVEQAMDWGR